MRILPNRHFIADFKKHYAENYAELRPKVAAKFKADKLQTKTNEVVESTKAKIFGLNFIAILLAVIVMGLFIRILAPVQSETEKIRQDTAGLIQQINTAKAEVQRYKNISMSDPKADLQIVADNIEFLQNIYMHNGNQMPQEYKAAEFTYFSGDYSYNWARDLDMSQFRTKDLTWEAYPDGGNTFGSTARIVMLLYNKNEPVYMVVVSYKLDDSKCASEISGLSKVTL